MWVSQVNTAHFGYVEAACVNHETHVQPDHSNLWITVAVASYFEVVIQQNTSVELSHSIE